MTTAIHNDPQEVAQRAALYRLLAQLYRNELTEALAERLRDSGLLGLLQEQGYDLETAALADPEELVNLRREFTRVFVGPGKHVAPYGSAHHPDDPKRGQLWGDTTTKVQRFVKDHGLEFGGKQYDGIPDHIAHELELFAKLLEGRAKAQESGDQERADRIRNSEQYLVREQLSRWVPVFSAKVRKSASRPFYAEIARLTAVLVEDESGVAEELDA
jgi:TorA maturation chaperone TorD